ncbi:uncharacterized protein LOC117242481 [Bombus vosnesenskii]|uniref:Uncharacterized protein LOC117242481 n=2 Tax=Pyrobombus TaxID=144703 RepID=A0A6J3LIJ6_9HYME|nr:uncharacterized protein LOC100747374 [Bombus impatiens]XP_033365080.1 uncharacterized protein LOC117242481 [Bombus vosnesenskii]XP_050493346.1 uncharacterized protein LOC126874863 [Bombus huntii]
MQSKSTITASHENEENESMEESVFEQICDTIFVLIPEVPRLKQLFLSWSQLGIEDRVQLDAKVANWCCPNRRQLYKPLQEALVRWETVQDTQGAPGCEPGMVSFSCDPQLEEELVSVIYSLELLFSKNRRGREIDMDYEIGRCTELRREMSLNLNCDGNLCSILSAKDRAPHSVHSCSYIADFKRPDEELSGYLTN